MNEEQLINGDQPATQHDLSVLAGELTSRFDKIEETMATKDQVATVLELVASIDQQLKDLKGIPEKVERLHQRVFPSR